MDLVLATRGLAKRYGRVPALEGLDLTVGRAEVYGFLGRNGAGKSTTIRILMGITHADRGEVLLFGRKAKGSHVKLRERIGYVAQEQSFYGWMSVHRLGRFVGAFYPTWSEHDFLSLCKRLDLPLDRRVDALSGGMRVKLALAAALSHRPELLILDEPTAGLDPVARREFLEIVRDDADRTGRSTFFSTHLIDEVELVADRVGIVDGGRMRYEGPVQALADSVRACTSIAQGEPLPALLGEPSLGVRVVSDRVFRGGRRIVLAADRPERWAELQSILPLVLERMPLEEIFIEMVRRD